MEMCRFAFVYFLTYSIKIQKILFIKLCHEYLLRVYSH